MKPKQKNKDYSLLIVILYLLLSFFGGLTFSILALRAKKNNNTVFWWFLLALVFIGIFGLISYSLVITSSAKKDAGWYYLGISTIIANCLACLILIVTLIKKPINHGTY
jgi:hypothetical protein